MCGRCVHAYEQSVCPCIHPADNFFVFNLHVYVQIFLSPVGLMPCLCVRPSIYLTAHMHAYVEVCAPVHSSVHPFVCIQECFILVGLLVGCFGFNGPLRQYFSLYRAVSQTEGERGERIEESKNVQTTPTRTYCKYNRPLPYYHPNCRTPRNWKFTQDHLTTRPPPFNLEFILWCF